MPRPTHRLLAALAFTLPCLPALAADPAPAPAAPVAGEKLGDVVVKAPLDQAREELAPELGADLHTFGPDQIATTPMGEAAPLSQLLLLAPGVVQDSYGQVHVHGDHNGLTYRVNGVLLPEGLNGFAQELDSRIIGSATLITGSLPAQFGFRTAGIVDVQTKTGAQLDGNEFSLYGGSHETAQGGWKVGGQAGKLDYFAVTSFSHSNLGLENPTDRAEAVHDRTNQEKLFACLSWNLDETSRISLIAHASNADFQIPTVPDAAPAYTLAGHAPINSSGLDENQNEKNSYGVLSYQKVDDGISFLASAYSRYGQLHFTPDTNNDLIFQGVATDNKTCFFTNGAQVDLALDMGKTHTLRAGLIGAYTAESQNTATSVFTVDTFGNQTSTTPTTVNADDRNWALESAAYAQDEWKLADNLTLNYGLRFDLFRANFDSESQLSPRVNLVWQVDEATTLHAGYARYFSPPPAQRVSNHTLAQFAGTTNEPENTGNDPVQVERSHYFDLGASHNFTKAWQVSLDGYYKRAQNLNDLGQFGNAIILSPFSYRRGEVLGADLGTAYTHDGLSLFGNLALVQTSARDINSAQYLFENAELAYIQSHDVHLDHESTWTGSSGASYKWGDNLAYADFLYGSGLRKGFANTETGDSHAVVNMGYQRQFHVEGLHSLTLRFDVLNVFDQTYQLHDGSGIGVGAPQYGQRRSFLGGVTVAF